MKKNIFFFLAFLTLFSFSNIWAKDKDSLRKNLSWKKKKAKKIKWNHLSLVVPKRRWKKLGKGSPFREKYYYSVCSNKEKTILYGCFEIYKMGKRNKVDGISLLLDLLPKIKKQSLRNYVYFLIGDLQKLKKQHKEKAKSLLKMIQENLKSFPMKIYKKKQLREKIKGKVKVIPRAIQKMSNLHKNRALPFFVGKRFKVIKNIKWGKKLDLSSPSKTFSLFLKAIQNQNQKLLHRIWAGKVKPKSSWVIFRIFFNHVNSFQFTGYQNGFYTFRTGRVKVFRMIQTKRGWLMSGGWTIGK